MINLCGWIFFKKLYLLHYTSGEKNKNKRKILEKCVINKIYL
jgi:hypothetical protein